MRRAALGVLLGLPAHAAAGPSLAPRVEVEVRYQPDAAITWRVESGIRAARAATWWAGVRLEWRPGRRPWFPRADRRGWRRQRDRAARRSALRERWLDRVQQTPGDSLLSRVHHALAVAEIEARLAVLVGERR